VAIDDFLHGVLQAAWSSDDRQLCGITPGRGAVVSGKGVIGVAELEVIDSTTGETRPAVPVGQLNAMQATVGVVACRPDDDFAVIRLERAAQSELDFVRLSTGAVLARYPILAGEYPPVSPDGSLIAEPTSNNASSTIRTIVNGTIVGHVEGQVIAFSGDDSRVVVEADGRPPHAGQTRIVDWRSGRVVADGTQPSLVGGVSGETIATRPGGSELCLLVYRGSSMVPDVVVVAADGRITTVGPAAVDILPVLPYG
jgi:hypothetical protein